MERYIGLDAHGASCTFGVIGPSGRKLRQDVVETNGAALVQYLRNIPGRKHLCLEEGTHSAWLYEILSPHVEEIVVAGIGKSRGQKSDVLDAFQRAEDLRTGTIKTRVFKAPRRFSRLRELSRVHSMLVGDVVRVQNRLKVMYRARGVPTPGKQVYQPKGREGWLKKLPVPCRWATEKLHEEYDRAVGSQAGDGEGTRGRVAQASDLESLGHCTGYRSDPGGSAAADRGDPASLSQPQPVLGLLRPRDRHALVVGLGPDSGRPVGPCPGAADAWPESQPQLATQGIFKGAATTIITHLNSDPLYEHYLQLTSAGTKPNLAKLTIARQVAAIVLRMWKDEKEYDPGKLKQQEIIASAVD